MVRIPDITDLGGVNVNPERRMGAWNPAPFAAGVERLGAGVAEAGAGVGDYEIAKARYESAIADTQRQAELIDLKAKLADPADTDYATKVARFTAGAQAISDRWAKTISLPSLADRFRDSAAPAIAVDTAAIQQHARAGMTDAANAYRIGPQQQTVINAALAEADPERRAQMLRDQATATDSAVGAGLITPLQAQAEKMGFAKRYGMAYYERYADTNPEMVIRELETEPRSGAEVTNQILQAEGVSKNPRSSATGAGQFINSTWLGMIRTYRPDLAAGKTDAQILALRGDRELGFEMTEKYRQQNEAALKAAGVSTAPAYQYLAHFLGPGGAIAVAQASPDTPVADALAAEVGAAKAKAMVDANPAVLSGATAGQVVAWAGHKMGGSNTAQFMQTVMDPVERETLLARARAQLRTNEVNADTTFKTRVADTIAEASRTGAVTAPMMEADFVGRFGVAGGPQQYHEYQLDLQAGQLGYRMASMSPPQRDAAIATFAPAPGATDYAREAVRAEKLRKGAGELFKSYIANKVAEAVEHPDNPPVMDRQEFIDNLGPVEGKDTWNRFQLAIQYSRDLRGMKTAGPSGGVENEQAREARIGRWTAPENAPDYAVTMQFRDKLIQASQEIGNAQEKLDAHNARLAADRDKDPAAYALKYMPAAAQAWQKFQTALASGDMPAMQTAARDYALVTIREQEAVGIPPDRVRLLPQPNLKALQGEIEKPQTSGGASQLYDRIVRESHIWGDNWSRIAGELSKGTGPAVRVMSHPIDPQAGQTLAELAPTPFATIAKDQDAQKQADIKSEVLKVFKPLMATMDGQEGAQRAFDDFRSQGEKLAAYYVAHDNMSSKDAAAKAWGALLAYGYDFTGSLRVPKDAGVTPGDAALATNDILNGMTDLQPEPRLMIPGTSEDYARTQTLKQVRRDGVWVTTPNSDGAVLMWNSRPVRHPNGMPVTYSWRDLAQRAALAREKESAAVRRAAEQALPAAMGGGL